MSAMDKYETLEDITFIADALDKAPGDIVCMTQKMLPFVEYEPETFNPGDGGKLRQHLEELRSPHMLFLIHNPKPVTRFGVFKTPHPKFEYFTGIGAIFLFGTGKPISERDTPDELLNEKKKKVSVEPGVLLDMLKARF